GVGTPNIIYDVKRDKNWLLFTGWKDPVGLKREGFVALIDESLNVNLSTIKKILPQDFPEKANYTNNVVRGLFNAVRDEFIVTTSHGNKIFLVTYDKDWNLKSYKELMVFKDVRDFGLPIRATGAYGNIKDAIAVTPDPENSNAIKIYHIKDVDDINKATVEDWGEIGRWGGNDVIELTILTGVFLITETNLMVILKMDYLVIGSMMLFM
ncbi:MAG: hypothetical protein JZD40_06725, partial [Sulfolobus sp.]|nr:hypothetical protein [Sulfolobus sp.]